MKVFISWSGEFSRYNDSVSIIKEPRLFVENIKSFIGYDVEAGLVNYFYIANGYNIILA